MTTDPLTDWLTDEQANAACERHGLSRLTDFAWNQEPRPHHRFRVLPHVLDRIRAETSQPRLF